MAFQLSATSNGGVSSTPSTTPEVVRLMAQELFELGFTETLACLQREAAISREPDTVSTLRRMILSGNWNEALKLCDKVKFRTSNYQRTARGVLFTQEYLHTIKSRGPLQALRMLRTEGFAASMAPETVTALFKGKQSDQCACCVTPPQTAQVWTDIEVLLSTEAVVPTGRLRHLLQQAIESQEAACVYHVPGASTSLLQDHCCDSTLFPQHQQRILRFTGVEVWSAVYSPNGTRLAAILSDNAVVVFDAQTHKAQFDARLPVSTTEPIGFTWCTDDLLVLVHETLVVLWDLERKESFSEQLPLHGCRTVAPGILGQLVIGSPTQGIAKLQVPWLKARLQFQPSTDEEESSVLNAGEPEAMAAAEPMHTTTEEQSTGMETDVAATAQGPSAAIAALPVHGISGEEDDAIKLLHVSDTYLPTSVIITPDKRHIAAICPYQNKLVVWEYDKFGRAIQAQVEEKTKTVSLTASPDSKSLVVCCVGSLIKLYTTDDLTLVREFTGHQCTRFILASCIGGLTSNYLLSGSEDARVHIWHSKTGKRLAKLEGHTDVVNSVAWRPSPTGLEFATASDDGSVRIWSTSKLDQVPEIMVRRANKQLLRRWMSVHLLDDVDGSDDSDVPPLSRPVHMAFAAPRSNPADGTRRFLDSFMPRLSNPRDSDDDDEEEEEVDEEEEEAEDGDEEEDEEDDEEEGEVEDEVEQDGDDGQEVGDDSHIQRSIARSLARARRQLDVAAGRGQSRSSMIRALSRDSWISTGIHAIRDGEQHLETEAAQQEQGTVPLLLAPRFGTSRTSRRTFSRTRDRTHVTL
eukprot:m.134201 g.134201  ORF g.134201 m.134201 type:complete len:805 (+) comp13954_c0_seq10:378-2792(+)